MKIDKDLTIGSPHKIARYANENTESPVKFEFQINNK